MIGAVLLEEMLIGSDSGEEARPSKRARGAAPKAPDTDKWLELARYVSLHDN